MNIILAMLGLAATAATLSAQTNIINLGSKPPPAISTLSTSASASRAIARPKLTIVTTNHVLISGTLVSEDSSNLVLLSLGENVSIPRAQIKWCETNLVNAPVGPPPAGKVITVATNKSAAIIAEFNKPHSEEEMRVLLQTQEGQALMKSIADTYIGSGTDTSTSAALASYYDTLRQFQAGSIGILEIQGNARGVLGQLGQYDKELNSDPNAEQWREYMEILQGFTSEPPPAPAGQVR